jgi:NAD(P)-dependent dehydrogenase (short-subunit alcohol dehydrogenase family)
MVARTVAEFGPLDILVHCVGVRGPVPVPVVDLDEATWRMLLDVNLTGAFLVSKTAARAMLADPAGTAGKKVVLVSSMAGVSPYPGGAGYCASKHGVLGLMKTLARELAPYKINVNAINPGAFETNFRDESLMKQAADRGISVEESLKNPPTGPTAAPGRLLFPWELIPRTSPPCPVLASERASHITGEDINLSGGAAETGGTPTKAARRS